MAGDKSLILVSGDRSSSISLYSWSEKDESSLEALEGITGFGMPDQVLQWFKGAGDGAMLRGARTSSRELVVPFTAEANDRAGLLAKMSRLATILDLSDGLQAQLRYMLPDGEMWFIDVARSGGGDWVRGKDSNERTYLNANIVLTAGDPFWTRMRQESFIVEEQTDVHLLPYLARLRVSSSSAFGTKEVENIGDARGWPNWTLKGPFTRVVLVGALGEILEWTGVVPEGDTIFIDSQNNLVYDNHGVNRYDGIAEDPNFWFIAPGTSSVYALMEDVNESSQILAEWRPRRWLVV